MTPQELTSEREFFARIAENQAAQWLNGDARTGVGQAYQRACRDVAEAIRSATRAAGDAVAWQPIETAPRDGTRFLAATTDDVVMGCYVNEQYFAADSFHGNRDTKPMFWSPVPVISRPDGMTESRALDDVAKIKAENAKLREVLKDIAQHPGIHADEAAGWMADAASDILTEIGDRP